MNLIIRLLINFFNKEKINTFFILITGIIVSIIETYGISKNIANIISTAQNGQINEIENYLKIFIFLCILYILFNYLYELLKNNVLTKIRQSIKIELIRILLKTNNVDFTDSIIGFACSINWSMNRSRNNVGFRYILVVSGFLDIPFSTKNCCTSKCN